MKKSLFILFVFIGLVSYAQRGSTITLTPDTIKGVDTLDYIIELRSPSYEALIIDVLSTNVGGISDGTIGVYGSLDGANYVLINGVGGEIITASPQASITGNALNLVTITDGLVSSWIIKDVPYQYYMLRSIGTADDTTRIAPKYRYK